MARKDVFAGIADQLQKGTPEEYVAHGAAKKMMMSLDEFAERARSQGGLLELDPALVDPSPFPDRLPDDDPQPFEDFKKSLAEDGQKVPVQVRAHPTAEGRYQVVYGHRRLRAAKELGLQLKAIQVEITDHELAVAQGIENATRQDLSWIERALFAKRMEEAGVKSRDIQAALSIDRMELAKLRAVWAIVPVEVIEAIGRAPKVGRRRWLDLAKLVELHPERLKQIREMLSADNISADSDGRFQLAMTAGETKTAVKPDRLDFKIVASTPRGKAFAKFVESRLPALIKEFEKGET